MEKELLKYMRRQRNILYIVGIIFLLMGVGFASFARQTSDVNQLYQEHKIYGSGGSDVVAMKVYEILGEVGSQENSKNTLYVVRYEHGYVGLIASSDDETIQPFLTEGANEKGILLAVKQVASPLDVERILRQSVAGSEIGLQMDFRTVASLTEYRKSQSDLLIAAMGLGILGVVMIVVGVVIGIQSRKALETLYVNYPELRDNLELLNTQASYSDDLLGIRVYKNDIVFLKGAWVVIDLNTVDWFYHQITTIYRGLVSNRSYQFLFFSYTQKKRGASLTFKRKKNLEENIQALYNYLSQEYPDMLIGFDQKATFDERKKAQSESYR